MVISIIPLRELMSKPAMTVEQTSSVREAMQIMNSKNIRRLVVVDKDQKMVGITPNPKFLKEIVLQTLKIIS